MPPFPKKTYILYIYMHTDIRTYVYILYDRYYIYYIHIIGSFIMPHISYLIAVTDVRTSVKKLSFSVVSRASFSKIYTYIHTDTYVRTYIYMIDITHIYVSHGIQNVSHIYLIAAVTDVG